MINAVTLRNILPDVFSKTDIGQSDVWLQTVKFEKGRNYLIEADSGRGKTSLCSYIMGMRRDYRGEIFFDGANVDSFGQGRWSQLRSVSLAWLPQEIGLFPNLTLWENIAIKNSLTGYKRDSEIKELIGALGVGDKMDVPASRLSIGQQQRVAFIRMLCQPADFFILDEPVSHLDAGNNELMANMLEQELKATGASAIITSVGNRMELPDLKTLTL